MTDLKVNLMSQHYGETASTRLWKIDAITQILPHVLDDLKRKNQNEQSLDRQRSETSEWKLCTTRAIMTVMGSGKPQRSEGLKAQSSTYM